MAIQTLNPYTNKVEKTFEAATSQQIEETLQKADTAFQAWRTTTFSQRATLMQRAGDELAGNTDYYAKIITLEMGKPLAQARGEVTKCAMVCHYYAQHAEEFLQEEDIRTSALRSFISFEPLGTVLAVMPWNFPFWQVFRFAAPALMAGNVGLLKHASNVPQCALAIQEVFDKVGFPEGCFQSLLIGSQEVEQLIKDDRIKAVTLTGSEAAGAKVAAVAGQEIKKTVLELGGSDAFIVLADADVEAVAKKAANARLINTGQSCIAAKRFILEKPIAEAFLAAFSKNLQKKKTGNPLEDDDIDYGPMARVDLAQELTQQVERAVAAGAHLYLPGGQPDPDKALFHPAILTDIQPGNPAYEEEFFGPVALVFIAKDVEEAVKIANDSPFGLGGSVWTNDVKRGQELAKQVEAGAVFVNAIVASDPALPFGGVKKSGYGRELSYLGIREFVNQKTIWVGEPQE
ncbi:NAD-dependent succinate-semialdehyde dehydrogenase [Rufibacter glacialis]|uniref:NAD-dependent succinate-semialdehyde dehydrogenase n=1 Tax=Rufibacter glacialis TaxID=1259555 RepID=A0A5M8QC57_9BACT|nr:NAD-dependent succinate-semialdehyde dehydrogenase [Rufibacter glacialis]KAA6432544.1 NAD-dependent succinate-semialdehyde dehydrogenase [Rufibacter glacialis]GGK79666.1 succinate-semialdehyde dehydrogenase [Rufibacter glacialis]